MITWIMMKMVKKLIIDVSLKRPWVWERETAERGLKCMIIVSSLLACTFIYTDYDEVFCLVFNRPTRICSPNLIRILLLSLHNHLLNK